MIKLNIWGESGRFRNILCRMTSALMIALVFILSPAGQLNAQEEEAPEVDRPVRSTFESVLLIDNQTVDVPMKGTFEFDIMHRFGTLNNGYDDFYGFYANSNIRLGFGYAPIENLNVGFGLTKFKHTLDMNAKYALLKQTRSGKVPVSITYFGNIAIDTRDEDTRGEVFNTSDRVSYFHQVMIGRRFNDRFSFQIAPSVSHYNLVDEAMDNDHFAVAFGMQLGLTESLDLIANYDQPITAHARNNPNPNVSLGLQIGTSSHAFQIFVGNYNGIVPQENNAFNVRNPNFFEDGVGFSENFLIGFNITRLWSY